MGNFQDSLVIFGAKYLIIFIIGIAFLYFINQPREKQKTIIILGIITLPIIYAVSQIVAYFYYDPRPFVTGHFVPLISHDPDNGFPSDHTLLSSAIAMMIFYYNRRVGIFLLILATFVGLARVLAGIHHITDVFGSMLITIIVFSLAYDFLLPAIIQLDFYKKYSTKYFYK